MHECESVCIMAVHYNFIALMFDCVHFIFLLRFTVCGMSQLFFQSCTQSDEVDNQNGCLSAVFNVVCSLKLLLHAVLV